MAVTEISTIDIQLIDNLMDALPSYTEWPNTGREEHFKVHQHTKSLFIRCHIQPYVDQGKILDHPPRKQYPQIEPILDFVTSLGYGKRIDRAVIAALPPHKKILRHVDTDPFFIRNRIHVPLKTNPNVLFHSGDIDYYMEKGKVYIINNNTEEHGVTNNSDQERLHLIVDVV